MGLDITIVRGRVHPSHLADMQMGKTIGSGLKYDGEDIVQVTDDVYYQRRMFKVRDALVKALNNGSESEYHLLTPSRVTEIIVGTTHEAERLSKLPGDVYFDEVQPLLDLASCMREIQCDESDELYFAIWG